MISHEHKVVFIHIPKCAGTSVEKALGHFDEPFFRAQDHRTVRQLEPLTWQSFIGRANLRQLKRRIHNPYLPYANERNKLVASREQWRRYFKFAVVRNPWSRTYSAYRAFLRDPARRARFGLSADMKFDDFCDKCLPAADLARPQTFWLLGADGKLGVDRVVKFHTLQEEMDQIADYYDLPLRNLPNLLNHSPQTIVRFLRNAPENLSALFMLKKLKCSDSVLTTKAIFKSRACLTTQVRIGDADD